LHNNSPDWLLLLVLLVLLVLWCCGVVGVAVGVAVGVGVAVAVAPVVFFQAAAISNNSFSMIGFQVRRGLREIRVHGGDVGGKVSRILRFFV
jgi:hypothetical protein